VYKNAQQIRSKFYSSSANEQQKIFVQHAHNKWKTSYNSITGSMLYSLFMQQIYKKNKQWDFSFNAPT